MSYSKLENRKENIQENPEITEEDKQRAEDFLKTVKRFGAKSPDTQEGYLRFYEHVLEKKEVTLNQVKDMSEEELAELNNEIVDEIQDSKYKRTSGDLSKRIKNHQWTAWQRILQTLNISTEKYEKHMPGKVTFSTNKAEKDVQADTKPEDLPTPREMRRFLKTMQQISEPQVQDRNISLILLLWSEGPRIGEALDITMDQVNMQGKVPKINIHGNKGSKDRTVSVGQGWKTLQEYIETHPKPRDQDAYLFYKKKNGGVYQSLNKQPLRRKIKMAHRKASVDFKVYGEPFHIFRKGFVTANFVNDILKWEEICQKQGKSIDAKKPDYLKLLLQDINAKSLDALGIKEDDVENPKVERMKGRMLTPMDCPSCGKINACFKSKCSSCGYSIDPGELPDAEVRENQVNEDEVVVDKEMAEKIRELSKEL